VVCLDRDEENEDELDAGMKELLAHAGIITARIHAKKSTLVTRKEVSGECIAKMIELRQQGHTLRSIANEIERQGFKTSHGDSVSYAKVRQLIDANGSETLLTKVVCGEGDKLEESCKTFIESRIVKTEGGKVTMGDVYPRYVSYCQANGKVPQPRNILGRHLIRALGRHGKKVAGARYWVGYSVN
jgi:hypothetical protein